MYFPGAYARYRRTNPSVEEDYHFALFLLRSGYAVLFPVYKGTCERGTTVNSTYPDETNAYRELVIQWSKDIGRSLDYLETRSDITMPDLVAWLKVEHGVTIDPSTLSKFLCGEGFTYKKNAAGLGKRTRRREDGPPDMA